MPANIVLVVPPPQWFVLSAIALVYVSVLIVLLFIRGSLRATGWRLGDALSEEGEITDSTGATVKQLMPSTSRLIAFYGLIVLILLFLGFGVFALYFFATGQAMNGVDDVIKFLLAGLSLFAPYAVNQTRAAIESLSNHG